MVKESTYMDRSNTKGTQPVLNKHDLHTRIQAKHTALADILRRHYYYSKQSALW
jgi:hypothetical protein